MLTRFRSMIYVTIVIVALALSFTIGNSQGKFGALNAAWAQVYNPVQDEGGAIDNTPADLAGFDAIFTPPAGGKFLGGATLSGFHIYGFDTEVELHVACPLVRVYRLTDTAAQSLTPSTCTGNFLTWSSVGTGQYFFVIFGSADAATNADPVVPYSANP